MRQLFWLLIGLSLCLRAFAQASPPDTDAAERARIAAERTRVEDAFRAQQKVCLGNFAVTDCVNAAKARRRDALADLRRQEISLNDAQRKRQAAERIRALDESRAAKAQREEAAARSAAQPAVTASAARAPSQPSARKAKASETKEGAADQALRRERAARREEQALRRKAEQDQARAQKLQEQADQQRRRQERQEQAARHKAELQKRLAERKKPPAAPLPVPP